LKISKVSKKTTANNQSFVGLAKPTMKLLLNGTDWLPILLMRIVVKFAPNLHPSKILAAPSIRLV